MEKLQEKIREYNGDREEPPTEVFRFVIELVAANEHAEGCEGSAPIGECGCVDFQRLARMALDEV